MTHRTPEPETGHVWPRYILHIGTVLALLATIAAVAVTAWLWIAVAIIVGLTFGLWFCTVPAEVHTRLMQGRER